jgi:hypothetical protein
MGGGGYIPPLSHMYSWRGDYLIKRRNKFTLSYVHFIRMMRNEGRVVKKMLALFPGRRICISLSDVTG